MGRRAARHRFVPGHYVFPGGRVDAKDYRSPALSPLRPEVAKQLGRNARALAIAAVRETYEETGLVLGKLDGAALLPSLGSLDYILRAITPSASPIRFHARFFAVAAEEMSGTLRGNGELLDLDWRPVAECLRLPIVDVTEYLLRNLGHLQEKEKGGQAALFSFRNGRAVLR